MKVLDPSISYVVNMLRKVYERTMKLVSFSCFQIIGHIISFLFMRINEQVCMTGSEFNKNNIISNVSL